MVLGISRLSPHVPENSVRLLVAAVGFFSDAYDLFILNICMVLWAHTPPIMTADDASLISTTAVVGAVVGQLGFGILADKIDRACAWVITVMCIIVGALMAALSWPWGALSLYAVIAIWRFVLGLGVGGEYPLSATIAAESTQSHAKRASSVSMVFSAQGLGLVASSGIFLLLLESKMQLQHMWRLAIGLGALPPMLTFYHRVRFARSHHMHEKDVRVHHSEMSRTAAWRDFDPELDPNNTDRELNSAWYKWDTSRDARSDKSSELSSSPTSERVVRFHEQPGEKVEKTEPSPMPSPTSASARQKKLQGLYIGHGLSSHDVHSLVNRMKPHRSWLQESAWPHAKTVAGTALSWFLFDVVFYGNGLFVGTIMNMAMHRPPTDDPRAVVWDAAISSMLIAVIGLPGYWIAICVINKWPVKTLQGVGFLALAALYFALGAVVPYSEQHPWLFLILYGCTFLVSNIGPNTTTFVLPTQCFPHEIRATLHGFSAAVGKAGAAVGAALMPQLLVSAGPQVVLFLCGGIALLGAICTQLLIPRDPYRKAPHHSKSGVGEKCHACDPDVFLKPSKSYASMRLAKSGQSDNNNNNGCDNKYSDVHSGEPEFESEPKDSGAGTTRAPDSKQKETLRLEELSFIRTDAEEESYVTAASDFEKDGLVSLESTQNGPVLLHTVSVASLVGSVMSPPSNNIARRRLAPSVESSVSYTISDGCISMVIYKDAHARTNTLKK
eukprot:g43161.t1